MLRTVTYQDLPSYHIGWDEGKLEERKKAVNILYSMGIDIDTISQKFDITQTEVKELLKG